MQNKIIPSSPHHSASSMGPTRGTSNSYRSDIHAGNGGNSQNDTNLSSGGRGGDVFLLHSNTNNISNVCHIYGHNVGTVIRDAPPSSDIYICLRYRTLELRIEFVPRLLPFIIVIRRHV
ncbi:hypothetical protein BS47DRAFT_1349852 [Hydnum rufescens UP504]|uniref:Uncharacterized protein n=1 Tax=Hydnum rufescens UP504 TaxID=1448309 RepID=A0A9P6AN39_9AGAM|nr:hypothetical protein BS47DRAFT_1349852 [Hydnum rufescens UP504]